jgi:hypothetical protein
MAFQADDDKGAKTLSLLMGVRVVNRVLDGGDFLGVFVGNFNAKLVFECHDQLYGVK